MHIWVEAGRTVVMYIIYYLIVPLDSKLKEMFTGNNPKVSHLKIFGCPVYMHHPKEKRTKLYPSEKKEYLLDTVKSPKPLEYTFQDSITWRSVGM